MESSEQSWWCHSVPLKSNRLPAFKKHPHSEAKTFSSLSQLLLSTPWLPHLKFPVSGTIFDDFPTPHPALHQGSCFLALNFLQPSFLPSSLWFGSGHNPSMGLLASCLALFQSVLHQSRIVQKNQDYSSKQKFDWLFQCFKTFQFFWAGPCLLSSLPCPNFFNLFSGIKFKLLHMVRRHPWFVCLMTLISPHPFLDSVLHLEWVSYSPIKAPCCFFTLF